MVKYFLKAFVLVTLSLSSYADKVSRIDIIGNRRIEHETVKKYLNLNSGDDFSHAKQDAALRNLYNTHFFTDIKMEFKNGVLTVFLKENPIINRIEVKGSNKIKKETILSNIYTKNGEFLNDINLKSDVIKIKEMYKRSGRFAVDASVKVEELPNNRVNIVFDVKEGPKTKIEKIHFIGNEHYAPSELKSIIMTKESSIFSFISGGDNYDPDRVEYDKELLKNFYNSVGYADFRVVSAVAELNPTKEGFSIVYTIDEGSKYKFGNIRTTDKLKALPLNEIEKKITIYTGQIFNSTNLESVTDNISAELANRGFPNAEVYYEIKKDYAGKVVNVDFFIEESPKVYVNRINIKNNVKTHDNVIRREFRIAEGDIFNQSQLDKSEQKLRNLDFFESVSIIPQNTTTTDKYDIDVIVDEKSTLGIGAEVGYATAGGFFGKVELAEKNLFGTGREFDIGVQRFQTKTTYNTGVYDPYFLDSDISLGLDVFLTLSNKKKKKASVEEQLYGLDTTGAKLRSGYNINDDIRYDVFYLAKRDHMNKNAEKNAANNNNLTKTNKYHQ